MSAPLLTDILEQIKNQVTGQETEQQGQWLSLLQTIADNLAASEQHPGIARLATSTEAVAGSATDLAVSPASMAAAIAGVVGVLPASTTVAGSVELATSAETITGTDAARAVTPAGLAANLVNMKLIGFTGVAAAGPATCTGAAVGDRVIAISNDTDGGQGESLFETAVTVIDQIQQSSATDLHLKKFTVLLLPVS